MANANTAVTNATTITIDMGTARGDKAAALAIIGLSRAAAEIAALATLTVKDPGALFAALLRESGKLSAGSLDKTAAAARYVK